MDTSRKKKEEILRILSMHLRRLLDAAAVDFAGLQEIRLRVGQPILLRYLGKEYFVMENGSLSDSPAGCYIVPMKEVRETLEYIGNFSLYAFEEEVRQGFITVQGGHRIGIAGKTVVQDGKVKTIKNISFLHIRLAHEITGCAENIMPYLYHERSRELCHTMVISPPGCGKTTLLRDIIRLLSDGPGGQGGGCSVGVVDERSEIAACYMGIPQNDLGLRTDVMDCCPKAAGMMMLIRSMAPQVVAVDEVGSREEMEAVSYAMHCGCRMLVTVHGRSYAEIQKKLGAGVMGQGGFERFLLLSRRNGPGTVEQIVDENGVQLNKR